MLTLKVVLGFWDNGLDNSQIESPSGIASVR
jgi:hypothetical protein